MFNWKLKATNAIYLEDGNGQEGRPFKARFLQAGLVKYDFGVCLLKKETIDGFINTFIGTPVIIDHKDDITEADRVGTINNIWFSPEDGWFWCDGVITDKKAIELIEKGYNVSCQYRITDYSDNTEGKLHNANPYDKEILNGVFEHLAIVENPRYEDAFIAVNAYIAKNKEFNDAEHPRDEDGKFTDGNNSSSSVKNWGTAYKEYSGKPKEAIDYLLKNKNGYVPSAITKEGIGDIDFVYGQTGKGGFGLAHIIEQRNKQGIDGETLIRNLPDIIEKGQILTKNNHSDRKYIISDDKEVAIRLDYNGEKRNWIVSAYIQNELPGSNSLENWHTMLAHDSNLSVANGYVSITTPVTNSITDNQINFNPNITISKETHKYNKVFDYIRNMKGESMDNETKGIFNQLIDALKARNEAEDEEAKKDKKDETASNEDVDKRDIIRQIMAIAGKHEDNEDVRTIAKLAEKLAYDKSEAGTADNGKAKNEDDEDDKKEVKNKCKNEDDTDYKKLYEDLKEKVEKEAENKKAKNSLDALKKVFFEGEDYKPESGYMTQKQGIELGKKLY